MGKLVQIDSEVLAEILRTHSPACCLEALGVLEAAGFDRDGKEKPLTLGGSVLKCDQGSRWWTLGGRCFDAKNLDLVAHMTVAELRALQHKLGVMAPKEPTSLSPDEQHRMDAAIGKALDENGKEAPKLTLGGKPVSICHGIGDDRYPVRRLNADGASVDHWELLSATLAELAAIRAALGVPAPEPTCAIGRRF
jgi:hypothetical protein